MAASRFLIAGLVLYIWRRRSGDQNPTKIEWRSAAIVGLFLLLGGNGGVVWAEQRIASGVTALIIASVPLWMVLLDVIRPNGQRPGWITLFGVLVGFAGIVILISPWQISPNAETIDLLGVGAVLLAALLWSIGSLYSRQAQLPSSPLLGTSMEMLVGGAALLAMGTLTGEWGRLDLTAITPQAWWSLAYLIFFGSLIAFAAYTWLLRNAPTPLVSTYAYVNPLVAILLGSLLAQETLTTHILLSTVIILSAVFMINTSLSLSDQSVANKDAPLPVGED
jgi:drug/metabolite transporter (DMT)-like permease